jgi:hypothetical protein
MMQCFVEVKLTAAERHESWCQLKSYLRDLLMVINDRPLLMMMLWHEFILVVINQSIN